MKPPSVIRIMREECLHQMLDCIAMWGRAHGEARDYWRWRAQSAIRDMRRLYLIPERRAFEAAVARSKQRRAA